MTAPNIELIERQLGATSAPAQIRGTSTLLLGFRVLVVDDEPCVLNVLRRILVRAGADVHAAESATTAFAAFDAFRPRLMVSDINMAVEDGYGLMRRIRARQNGDSERLAAIALTGLPSATGHREALRAGFNSYLPKPVTPTALVDAALELLIQRSSGC